MDQPPATTPDGDTLITADYSKLPPQVAALLDVNHPIPSGVQFFERKIVFSDLAKTIALSVGLGLTGLVCLPAGVLLLWDARADRGTSAGSGEWWVIGFGVTLLFASFFMATSFRARWKRMNDQSAGKRSRFGIFVLPDALMEADELSVCLIPRAQFVGLRGDALHYKAKGVDKSIRLPAFLMDQDPRAMFAAIDQWARRAPPALSGSLSAPPPLPRPLPRL